MDLAEYNKPCKLASNEGEIFLAFSDVYTCLKRFVDTGPGLRHYSCQVKSRSEGPSITCLFSTLLHS